MQLQNVLIMEDSERSGLFGEPRHADEPDDICIYFLNKDKQKLLFWYDGNPYPLLQER